MAWAAGADPGFYVLDFDGTLIGSHSDKQGAAPTYKKGFGFHPLVVFLDATGEALAGILRPGNAGSNTTADHVRLLDLALEQLPVDPAEVEVVARADSAALTHGFVEACRAAKVRFSIGHDLTEPIRNACLAVPKRRWRPAVTADGADEREGAEVAEITDLVDLSRWPPGTRAIARREVPHREQVADVVADEADRGLGVVDVEVVVTEVELACGADLESGGEVVGDGAAG